MRNECVDPLITRGSDMSVSPCRSSSLYRGRCVRVVVCVGATIVLWGSPPRRVFIGLRGKPGPRVSRSLALRWRLGSPTECH